MADRLKITLVACSFHINFNLVKVRVNKISTIDNRRDRKNKQYICYSNSL